MNVSDQENNNRVNLTHESGIKNGVDDKGSRDVKESERAQKRWSILARAISRESDSDSSSSGNEFTTFDIFTAQQLEGNWVKYSCESGKYYLKVQLLQNTFSTSELIGFNNTGNVRIWPSEEALAYYIILNLNMFTDKTVIELGCGLSSLAGLILAKYGSAKQVFVTDGNYKCINNVESIIEENNLKCKASCAVLEWKYSDSLNNNESPLNLYDVILVADCIFFEESRQDLVDRIWLLLSLDGVVLIMTPHRGKSLENFVIIAKEKGFKCDICENYNTTIWNHHCNLKRLFESYDPNVHYPLLLTMTKV